MNRTDARALAGDALTALGVFAAIFQGAPDRFDGKSPVAVVSSRTMRLDAVARELYTVVSGISVSIYVRQDDAAAAEDDLDELTETAILALHLTGAFETIADSSADPAGGARRFIDGKVYRVERIPLTVLDEGGD